MTCGSRQRSDAAADLLSAAVGADAVAACLEGKNAAVLAYGQASVCA